MKNYVFPNRILLAGIFILFSAFVSCSKDEELTENEQLLTFGKWNLSSHAVDPPLTFTDENDETFFVSDLVEFLGECYADDSWTFKPDKTLVMDEGSLICDDGSVQQVTGEWYFGEGETSLIVVYNDGSTSTLFVQQLTAGTLKLNTISTQDNVTHTFTITFSR